MLLDALIQLRSKGLVYYYAGTKTEYDVVTGVMRKQGGSLNEGDRIHVSDSATVWEVKGFEFPKSLNPKELTEGQSYEIVAPRDRKVHQYRLARKDAVYDWYQFLPHDPDGETIGGSSGWLPPVFENGKGRVDPTGIIIESSKPLQRKVLTYDEVKGHSFVVDLSSSHVIVAKGKGAYDSPVHITLTPSEPHAVCCIEGLKVSLGMHNFGEKRWGSGIIDDIRSHADQNTRIVGDFTKSVLLRAILDTVMDKLMNDRVWKEHFDRLPETFSDRLPSLRSMLQDQVSELANLKFQRTRLQTRFFELGDNYYIGK